MSGGLITTFYSYKGGVGRTFALANVAARLARWGHRVLAVDWDLEAPGLHLYFRHQGEARSTGIVDMIEGFEATGELDWRAHVAEIALPEHRAPLHLLSAGSAGEGYVARMQALRWDSLYERGLGDQIEAMREAWMEAYDFILIDSRTGYTDIGGICTIQLPDVLVLVGTANRQSIDGLTAVAGMAERQRDRLTYDRARLLVLPVLSRFEARVEYERGQKWMSEFSEAFAPWIRHWAPENLKPQELLAHVRVPHVPYWSFGEELALSAEESSDPESIGYSLDAIAALLEHRLVNAHHLVGERERYITESAERKNGYRVEALILSPAGDAAFAEELATALQMLDCTAAVAVTSQPLNEELVRGAKHLLPLVSRRQGARDRGALGEVRRIFYADERPGRILPVMLDDARLPDLLVSFEVLSVGRLTAEDAAVKVVDFLRRPRSAGNLLEEPDPLFEPVRVSVVSATSGLRIPTGDARVQLVGDDLMFKFGDRAYAPVTVKVSRIGSVVMERGLFDHPILLLRVSDPLKVVESFDIRLSNVEQYELLRLRKGIQVKWSELNQAARDSI